MDWSNERYVRLYTRDTPDWMLLSWEARSLWMHLLRKLDRSGVLELGRHSLRGLAAAVGMPIDVVARALPELIEDGCLQQNGNRLVAPNYLDANETAQSDAQRAREYRERRRVERRDQSIVVTNGDAPATERDVTVTANHAASRGVTARHSVPCRAVPIHADPKEASEAPPRRPPPPEAVRVAEQIAEHVLRRDPKTSWLKGDKRGKAVAKWADSIRLLHEGGRSWSEIDRVWQWASQHKFWAANVLSGGKLREQFDKLVQQMVQPPNGHSSNPHNPRPATGANEDPILNRVRP